MAFDHEHPHDALFRQIFADPLRAAELARAALPVDIVQAIDWTTLAPVPASFVDAELRDHEADLLFTASAAGKPVLLYVLFEHKSVDEHFTMFQLLRYVVRIWERCRQEEPGLRCLPPVLPVLLHHGPQPWRSPLHLRELIESQGLPAGLLAVQPELSAVLFDLARLGEQELLEADLSRVVRATLLFLQHLRGSAQEDALSALTRWKSLLLGPPGHESLVVLLSYVLTVVEVQPEQIRAALATGRDGDPQTTMKTAAQYLIEEGRELGLRQGRDEGRSEGLSEGRSEGLTEGRREGRDEGRQAMAQALSLALERRFGVLPESIRERIRAAELEVLLEWVSRVGVAASLEDAMRT